MQYIAPLAKLIEQFRRLPGIGSKTATRLAYHVLEMEQEQVRNLSQALLEAKEKVGYCSICFNLTDCDPCQYCRDQERDGSIVCVVEGPQDVAAMERTREYKGLYHVLHGALSPLDGIGPDELRFKRVVGPVAKKSDQRSDYGDKSEC